MNRACSRFFFVLLLFSLVALRATDGTGDPLASASKEKPFVNSLGMEFVPVPGTKVLFCRWETRVKDYEIFAKETKREWPKPDFEQGPAYPAVNVSWEDAVAFCAWLGRKEGRTYRLPTDAEWSLAVGLPEEKGRTPQEKSGKIQDVFPWGAQWPPPKGAGNFRQKFKTDAFEHTSPVGSFSANSLGIFDLGGNVWEWCDDRYNEELEYRVFRGGAWDVYDPAFLLSSDRNFDGAPFRCDDLGFRVVVVVPGG